MKFSFHRVSLQKIPRSVAAAILAVLALVRASTALAAGPEVKSWFPAGGARGTTVDVTATGTFSSWPAQAWASRPGVTIAAVEKDKGLFKATIAADTTPGMVWVRAYDPQGASAPQPFIVGTLPEILEQEPNNEPRKSQSISVPAVIVNGQLGVVGDVDMFGVTLQKGQTLVASVEAHETLGSPFDGVLQIVSARGNVVAFNHDTHGLDPQIVLVAPADGIYHVRLFGFPATPNSTIGFAGSSQYIYRLTLTTGPMVDYAWPLAVTRGRESRVELCGWNIPESLKSILVRPEDLTCEILDPQIPGGVTLPVEPHQSVAEVEPNPVAAPQKIQLNATVSGRIDGAGDVDVFGFAGKKGEPLEFKIESRAIGYPLDAVLEISDATGKSLARVDDVGSARDAVIAFSPPEDGDYRIAVSDLNHAGSSRHVYRLRAMKAMKDFEVTADLQSYTAIVGKPVEITLSITRKNGFDEPIEFRVTGLPEQVTAAAAHSAPTGDSAKTVKLALTAKSGPSAGPIRVMAESAGASKLSRLAAAAIPARPAQIADLWLTVAPEAGK